MAFGDGQDFSPQLSTMLAPYQSAIQRLQTPYATLGRGLPPPQLPGFLQHIPGIGGLSQNINERLQSAAPGINAHLDNAFLTAAMTPQPQGPEGFGGGFSRIGQGLAGANQYRMQRALQMAMLPYQMIQPRLQAEDVIAQIGERRSEIPYRHAMEQRAMAQSDWYTRRAGALDQMKALTGSHIDDEGKEWRDIFDPVAGRVRQFDPASQKYSDELPVDKRPSFKNQEKQQRMLGGSNFLGQLVMGAYPPRDPSKGYTPEEYGTLASSYAGLTTQMAGGKKAAETSVTTPIEKTRTFVANEQKNLFTDIPKAPEIDFYKWYADHAAQGFKSTNEAYQAFQKEHNDYFTKKADITEAFDKWQQSGAPEQGVGFREWQKQQTKGPSAGGKTQLPF